MSTQTKRFFFLSLLVFTRVKGCSGIGRTEAALEGVCLGTDGARAERRRRLFPPYTRTLRTCRVFLRLFCVCWDVCVCVLGNQHTSPPLPALLAHSVALRAGVIPTARCGTFVDRFLFHSKELKQQSSSSGTALITHVHKDQKDISNLS